MELSSTCTTHKGTILDRLAISMAFVCAIHCLVTPFILIALPIIATTFWVHEDFHIWMLAFVIPTTGFAVFAGCRRHKDKWVAASAAIGLSLLAFAVVREQMAQPSISNTTPDNFSASVGGTGAPVPPSESAMSSCCPMPEAAATSSCESTGCSEKACESGKAEVAQISSEGCCPTTAEVKTSSCETAGCSEKACESSKAEVAQVSSGGCCPSPQVAGDGSGGIATAGFAGLSSHALLNALGGLFLILGHARNYLLCRKASCCH